MTEHPTVLLVDDDPDVRALSAACLQTAGYEAVTAPDPGGAHDVLHGRRPDLLLLAATSPLAAQVTPLVRALPQWENPVPVVVLLDPPPGVSHDDGAPPRVRPPGGAAHEGPPAVSLARWAPGVVEVVSKPLTPLLLLQVVEDAVATSADDAATRRGLAMRIPRD